MPEMAPIEGRDDAQAIPHDASYPPFRFPHRHRSRDRWPGPGRLPAQRAGRWPCESTGGGARRRQRRAYPSQSRYRQARHRDRPGDYLQRTCDAGFHRGHSGRADPDHLGDGHDLQRRELLRRPGRAAAATAVRPQAPLNGLNDSTDPNLGAFARAGGKIIIWHGLADSAINPFGAITYYKAVVQDAGGFAVSQRFSRLYMVPGGYHCLGGGAP
jgi:hypothetical protein